MSVFTDYEAKVISAYINSLRTILNEIGPDILSSVPSLERAIYLSKSIKSSGDYLADFLRGVLCRLKVKNK